MCARCAARACAVVPLCSVQQDGDGDGVPKAAKRAVVQPLLSVS